MCPPFRILSTCFLMFEATVDIDDPYIRLKHKLIEVKSAYTRKINPLLLCVYSRLLSKYP